MDLSIIIPCHNLEGYIEKCIDSILAQDITGYECEIIFVCDNCIDKTSDIIANKMITERNFQWTIWTCENNNPGQTRNVGLETCHGDYIWFIDGDDWLIDNLAIQKGLNFLIKDSSLDYLKFNFKSQKFNFPDLDVMVWRYIFKYKSIEKIRFIKTTPHEDVDFIKQVKELRLKGSTISEEWYWYNYPRENSIMFNTRKAKEKTDHGKPPWKK
jgi:glycosyltransferase involved in cell wall biosynthesis